MENETANLLVVFLIKAVSDIFPSKNGRQMVGNLQASKQACYSAAIAFLRYEENKIHHCLHWTKRSHQHPFGLTQKLFDETAIHHAVIAIGFSRESTHKRNINHFHNVNCCSTESQASHAVLPEMSIYRDKLSTIVIGDNFLSIIVIAQNNCDLSITVFVFVIYFVIAEKLSR